MALAVSLAVEGFASEHACVINHQLRTVASIVCCLMEVVREERQRSNCNHAMKVRVQWMVHGVIGLRTRSAVQVAMVVNRRVDVDVKIHFLRTVGMSVSCKETVEDDHSGIVKLEVVTRNSAQWMVDGESGLRTDLAVYHVRVVHKPVCASATTLYLLSVVRRVCWLTIQPM